MSSTRSTSARLRQPRPGRRWAAPARTTLAGTVCGLALGLGACAMPDSAAVTGVAEAPGVVKSEHGALAYYQGVLDLYGIALNDYAQESGLLTDELRPEFDTGGTPTSGRPSGVDARAVPAGGASVSFAQLQGLRANARQARWALATYALAAPKALIGHLYAIEGLADVLLADLYCSGIPLSTVNPDGSFTLKAGSPTPAVYRTAIALFDSAVTLAADSARIRDFARVGRARALLALGRADSAAAAAHDVTTEFAYAVTGPMFISWDGDRSGYIWHGAQGVVSDREGTTGLPYAFSGDPRTATDTGSSVGCGGNCYLLYPRYFARKYAADGTTPMVVASGIEARLIEAEAALRAGQLDTWANTLNALRATSGIAPLPADSTTDALPALQVRVMFAERAAWLFLTGHRQGDLRRLLRQYGAPEFTPSTVYPSGPYPTYPIGTYGADVTLPVPADEQARNPFYHGCQSRDT